jgi:DNA-binding SARP family transcriptional activator
MSGRAAHGRGSRGQGFRGQGSPGRGSRGHRLATALRGSIALATLVVLVIGLPLALYRLGGDPLPRHAPAWHQVTATLLHRDNGTVFLATVRDLSWIAWALFTAAVVTEVQAALRGRRAPRLRIGGLQNAAGWLVAVAALAFASQPAAVLASTHAPVPVVAPDRPSPSAARPASLPQDRTAGPDAAGPQAPQVMSMGFSQMVTVRSGDCLWTIAQHYLGSGDLYPEIVKLNFGHDMGNGQRFTDPSVVWPGWVLQLPAAPDGPSTTAPPTPAAHSASHAGHNSSDPRYSHPHPAASASAPAVDRAGVPAATPAAGTDPSVPAPSSAPSSAPSPAPAHAVPRQAERAADVTELSEIPPYAIFGAGVLVGGTLVALARMRRRQRQARRFGRRIPLPASAPVIAAEQRLRAAAAYPPADESEHVYPGTGPDSGPLWYDGAAAEPDALYAEAAYPDAAYPDAAYPDALYPEGGYPEGGYPEAGHSADGYSEAAYRRDGGSAPVKDGAEPARRPYPGAATGGDTMLQPVTALRAALSRLGSGLVAAGQPIPDITGIRVHPSGMELLLDSPSSDPPPAPFAVPGGRQGKAWQLELPRHAPSPPLRSAGTGDLLPGLLTAGVAADGGYVLIDLEYLRVTTVDGPADLADLVLATAAAELTTSQLAGWYDLILAGFPELAPVDGRATSCDSLAEALDLLASKAVALRRRLGDADRADVRRRRLADPGDEDWALTLLVSRTPPTTDQLAMLLDLASEPGGIAALVVGGTDVPDGHPAPASFRLDPDLAQPGGIVGHVSPLHLDVWPQPLTRADYEALASLFATAADTGDVAADEPPYDGSSWPPAPELTGLEEPPDAAPAGLEEPPEPVPAGLEEPPEPVPAVPGEPLAAMADPDRPPLATPALAGAPSDQPDPPADGGAESQEPGLRIGVIGTFTVNGAPAALQPAQSQLILALALNGRAGLSNAQLCYLLGPDPDHPKPSDSLRQLIVRTRRQLGRAADGREWIEHLGAGQYALHPDAQFDWADFEELTERGIQARDESCLRKALALVRGKPFTGCYHWWLDLAFTETVRAQIVDAAELLAALELAAGDPSASARAARTGLSGDVAAEQLWRALMRAEHAAGNLSGVREAWSRCLDTMADIAADGEPHPETAELYQQLISGASPQPAWARSYR